MSVDLAELGFSVNSDGFVVATERMKETERQSKKTESTAQRLEKQFVKTGASMQKVGGKLSLYVTTPMIAASIAAVKLAVDAEEVANKFAVVFRGSVEKAEAQLKELTKTIPLTVTQMKGLTAQTQDMLVPMGLARKEAAELSITALKLAGDIASFNNVETDEVLRNISSALAGQSEPLRKYGIDVRQSRLETIALKEGLIGVGEELDNAATAQAVFIAITQDSADAIGDAARTVDATANQTRFLTRDIVEQVEVIGKQLVPVYRELLGVVRQGVDWFTALTPETQQLIFKFIAFTAALGPLLIALGSIVRIVGVLLPLMAKLRFAMLWSPAGLLIGLGALVKLLGEIYIAKLNAAIETTGKFTTSLEKLKTVAGLSTNLGTVADEVDRLIAKQKELTALIPDAEARDMRSRSGIESAEPIRAELEQVNRELANAIQLRDSLTSKVREAIIAEQEAAKAAADAAGAGGNEIEFKIDEWQELLDFIDPGAKKLRDMAKARDMLADAFKRGKIDPAEFERLNIAIDFAFGAIDPAIFTMREMDAAIAANLQSSFDYVDGLGELREELSGLESQLFPIAGQLKDLADAKKLVQKAFDEGIITDPKELDRFIEGIDKAIASVGDLGATFEEMATEWYYALNELAGLFEQDSREAEALNTVIQALNVVMGIHAVIKQLAEGDVYSAIPRALGVAAMIASMGVHTGASGGGTPSRSLQESQGTGSVLGDTESKTESILNAMEITADATSELVGINRGMLHALIALQNGIENAVVKLARGGNVDFGALPGVFDARDLLPGKSIIGSILNKIFGGKAKVIDEGVRIVGGTLDEMINETLVQAFRTVSVKKHIFASTKIKQEFEELGDEIAEQFGLVFESIRDTVVEAALALGIPLDIIEERLASFVVATQDISFKDLTAEEQEAELLAVFGQIFDDLASHVIPFIDQFQKVGEGMGETLVRVATSVQIFKEAVNALGLVIDTTDPEVFAQMAVGLVEMTGGVENFIAKFTTFFDKFASDEQKLAFATDQINRAFSDVGLTVPMTRDGMIDLMQSLDATTEAGREQIAMLLNIADVADQYYSLVEAAEEKRSAQALASLRAVQDFVGSGPSSQLQDLRDRFEEAMRAARSLGASQREYAMIARSFDMQLKRMATELMISIIQMKKTLFAGGSIPPNSTIPDPRGAADEVRTIANSLFTDWQRALEDLLEFTQSLLLDDQLSPLTPAQRLAEAQSQFDALLTAAQGGDVDAAAALPDAAAALLEEARFMFASGEQYQAIFDRTLAALEAITMPGGIPEFITEIIPGGGGGATPEEPISPEDRFLEELQRFLLATDLAVALRELSHVLDVSVIALAEELGIPLDQLVEILGVELSTLTSETAAALAGVAALLGADIFELMEALDVGLHDLAIASGVHIGEMSMEFVAALKKFSVDLGVNVLDLAKKLGISLGAMAALFGVSIDNFSASQFQALAAFSDALGASITEVAESLGINLGEIRDATSLISEAFSLAMAELPDAIQADLGPLLDAIREATTEADATAAIQALGDYVLDLPDGIGDQLIPFLSAIGYQINQGGELSQLQSINSKIGTTNSILLSIKAKIGGGTSAPVVNRDATDNAGDIIRANNRIVAPSMSLGGPISRTGLYNLHKGEFVVNPTASNLAVAKPESDQLSSDELTQIRNVLEDIREQNKRYYDADLSASRGIESSMKQQAEQTRRQRNG